MIMKRYIGTKIIHAEIAASPKDGIEGYKVVYADGYTSWSPRAAFEDAYRPCDSMTFGLAMEALKAGKRVARAGWNGAGQFVYLVQASSYPAQTGIAKAYFGADAMVPYRAYLALKTAQGDVATWVPSCSDALAEDWQIVE